MSSVRPLIARLFIMLSIALGRMPRVVTLLDLLQRPSVARVMITRRRQLDYTDFFSPVDLDGRHAAPIARSTGLAQVQGRARRLTAQDAPDRIYIAVRTA